MTTLVDVFGGSSAITAHVADSGHMWEDAPHFWFDSGTGPDMTVDGGSVTADLADGAKYPAVSSNIALDADCYLEARLHIAVSGSQVGFGLRYNNADGRGIFMPALAPDNPTTLSFDIEAWLGGGDGGDTIVSGGETIPVGSVLDCVVRIELEGNTIRVYGDGVLAQTYTSSYVTAAGTVGFSIARNGGTSAADSQILSLTAGNLGSAPTIFWTNFVQTSEVDV